MSELLSDVSAWLQAGRSVALATVVRTWGSAPRTAGSKMAVTDRGEISGSVSGGCVEAAIAEEAQQVLKEHRPRRLHYRVSDETAWDVGLTCGGEIDIFLEPLRPTAPTGGTAPTLLDVISGAETAHGPFARAVVVQGPPGLLGRSILIGSKGVLAGDSLAALVPSLLPAAEEALQRDQATTCTGLLEGHEVEVLLDPLLPPPTLILVGGVHIAILLAHLAHTVGYRVVVVDPRRAFATPDRFPEAEKIETDWPDEALRRIGLTGSTAVAVLSHDPKIDDPALLVALRSPAFYVGALGSVRSQARRRSRLLAAGMSESELVRLHAPIGLDLGRHDPAGVALGIMAEVVATRSASVVRGQPPS